MADDILSRVGLYMDEVNKLRLMDPEKATQTNELKEECDNFVSNIDEFQQLVTRFMKQIDDVAKEVNKQKMRATGARNMLRSVEKEKEAKQQELEALLTEKATHLHRLRTQYDSLVKLESEQNDFIEQFLMHG
ncbi:hypothetical protein SNEBB_004984 [Seison nebaliae]|nr:hypothetical protein SNEBB_004984 [Seison nebaliae]